MSKFIITLILTLGFALGCQKKDVRSEADGGDIVGNGGDSLVLEFKQLAQEGLALAKSNSEAWPELDFESLNHKITSAEVVSTEQRLVANGKPKDAVNIPSESKIYVNRTRWNALASNDIKRALVFHEYLGLIDADDTDYVLSSQLLDFDPVTFAPVKKRVDILVVVDSSGSMEAHQKNMANRIHLIINSIVQKNIDYHIGVTSADVNDRGRLLGAVPFVTNHTPDGINIIAESLLLGSSGSGIEDMLTTAMKVFSPKMICQGCPNDEFLRRSANLEIITLSDADDSGNIDPRDIAKTFIQLKQGDASRVSFTSFLPLTESAACKRESDPKRMIDVVSLLNGDIRDLCAPDLNVEYNKTAERIVRNLK